MGAAVAQNETAKGKNECHFSSSPSPSCSSFSSVFKWLKTCSAAKTIHPLSDLIRLEVGLKGIFVQLQAAFFGGKASVCVCVCMSALACACVTMFTCVGEWPTPMSSVILRRLEVVWGHGGSRRDAFGKYRKSQACRQQERAGKTHTHTLSPPSWSVSSLSHLFFTHTEFLTFHPSSSHLLRGR